MREPKNKIILPLISSLLWLIFIIPIFSSYSLITNFGSDLNSFIIISIIIGYIIAIGWILLESKSIKKFYVKKITKSKNCTFGTFFFINSVSWIIGTFFSYYIIVFGILFFFNAILDIDILSSLKDFNSDNSFTLGSIFFTAICYLMIYVVINGITILALRFFYLSNSLETIFSMKFVLFFRIFPILAIAYIYFVFALIYGTSLSILDSTMETTKNIQKEVLNNNKTINNQINKFNKNIIPKKHAKTDNINDLIQNFFSTINKQAADEKEKELLILKALSDKNNKINIEDLRQYYKLQSEKDKKEIEDVYNLLNSMYNPNTGLFSEIIKFNEIKKNKFKKLKLDQILYLDSRIEKLLLKLGEIDAKTFKLYLKTIKWKPIGDKDIDYEMDKYYSDLISDIAKNIN